MYTYIAAMIVHLLTCACLLILDLLHETPAMPKVLLPVVLQVWQFEYDALRHCYDM